MTTIATDGSKTIVGPDFSVQKYDANGNLISYQSSDGTTETVDPATGIQTVVYPDGSKTILDPVQKAKDAQRKDEIDLVNAQAAEQAAQIAQHEADMAASQHDKSLMAADAQMGMPDDNNLAQQYALIDALAPTVGDPNYEGTVAQNKVVDYLNAQRPGKPKLTFAQVPDDISDATLNGWLNGTATAPGDFPKLADFVGRVDKTDKLGVSLNDVTNIPTDILMGIKDLPTQIGGSYIYSSNPNAIENKSVTPQDSLINLDRIIAAQGLTNPAAIRNALFRTNDDGTLVPLENAAELANQATNLENQRYFLRSILSTYTSPDPTVNADIQAALKNLGTPLSYLGQLVKNGPGISAAYYIDPTQTDTSQFTSGNIESLTAQALEQAFGTPQDQQQRDKLKALQDQLNSKAANAPLPSEVQQLFDTQNDLFLKLSMAGIKPDNYSVDFLTQEWHAYATANPDQANNIQGKLDQQHRDQVVKQVLPIVEIGAALVAPEIFGPDIALMIAGGAAISEVGQAYTTGDNIHLVGAGLALAGISNIGNVDSALAAEFGGHTPTMQEAIANGIPEDTVVGFRDRPLGANEWDGMLTSKPQGAINLNEGANGLRTVYVPLDGEDPTWIYKGLEEGNLDLNQLNPSQVKQVVSDLDAQFVIRDGKLVSQNELYNVDDPEGTIAQAINDGYGPGGGTTTLINHGDQVSGMLSGVPGALSQDYLSSQTFVYGPNGVVDSGTGWEMLQKYLSPDELTKLKNALGK